jgi:hypothetical protein
MGIEPFSLPGAFSSILLRVEDDFLVLDGLLFLGDSRGGGGEGGFHLLNTESKQYIEER